MTQPATIEPQRLQEQKRAAHAWKSIHNAQGILSSEGQKKYGQIAQSAPADIIANGLGQTLAFWKAKEKKEKPYNLLLNDLSNWMQSQPGLNNGDLLPWITNTASTAAYRRATAEAIAYLTWVKRFAEAELG